MLTLEEMFENHNSSDNPYRKILFEEGLWCIYERIPEGGDDRFHLIHRCSVNVKAVYLDGFPVKCRGCNTKPPDEILGLLKLHKWGMGDDKNDY
jgi:hypothetical protein